MISLLDLLVPIIDEMLLVIAILFFLGGLDDLVVDLIAFVGRVKPKRLTEPEFLEIKKLPEKKLALMIPAWDEGEIIERMLVGNIEQIDYQNYEIFVGCYPNDPDTIAAVERVSDRCSFVHAVVNYKSGPTSKGQILNHVIERIKSRERECNEKFDALVMQDAEDIIHPYTFRLMNKALDTHEFVQTPVFSLPTDFIDQVSGTYIDEFAENHTKDVLVRGLLGAAIPSAGVGTAIKSTVMNDILGRDEFLFNEGSVTEDYELGLNVARKKYSSIFLCTTFLNSVSGKNEYIATREFFPNRVVRSVRQKARWNLGICLQGWRNLRWFGGLAQRFFLYRDRKGIFTNPLTVLGYFLFALVLISPSLQQALGKALAQSSELFYLTMTNLALLVNRAFWRMRSTYRVYGFWFAILAPLRIPLSNFINGFASFVAMKRYLVALATNKNVAWGKTHHRLPVQFGGTSAGEEGCAVEIENGL